MPEGIQGKPPLYLYIHLTLSLHVMTYYVILMTMRTRIDRVPSATAKGVGGAEIQGIQDHEDSRLGSCKMTALSMLRQRPTYASVLGLMFMSVWSSNTSVCSHD